MWQSRTSRFTIHNVKERKRHRLFRESVPEALVEHQTLIIAFVPLKGNTIPSGLCFISFFPLGLLLKCAHDLTLTVGW